ncbi:hypothetical protein CTKZ_34580 [Cellulomonas algicola]|uniref:DUF3017 domain-containing protein n=1 Tax=Cellulomonas algicola TaxID=2071633 RepID=A0A401V4U3_9CELL|nr:DUF3017 domain-containing protein [Cellulomonas algicola]GCD21896.1 hypothetical protein CTKZ_34580 [Cellulomonas algicola]
MVQERVGPQWPRMTHESSSAEPDVPPATGPIPVEEAPLDPRAIARASLDAARNASLWWTSAGVLLSVLVAFVVGARAGAYTLAGVMALCGVVRAAWPSPGPVAISVRSKPLDLVLLFGAALSLGVLAHSLPPGA